MTASPLAPPLPQVTGVKIVNDLNISLPLPQKSPPPPMPPPKPPGSDPSPPPAAGRRLLAHAQPLHWGWDAGTTLGAGPLEEGARYAGAVLLRLLATAGGRSAD